MTNVTNWEHQIKNKLTAFPDIGQAIRTKTLWPKPPTEMTVVKLSYIILS